MIRPDGIYEHYKGKKYHVLGVAKHSETGEALVVYEAMYPCDQILWVRPLKMFEDMVVLNNGVEVPRFRLLSNA